MFHNISERMAKRMRELGRMDAADRDGAAPRLERLRQVPAETGNSLRLLAASAAPAETGSRLARALGLFDAVAVAGLRCAGITRIQTFEVLPRKVAMAKETFQLAGVEDVVELVEGDAGSTWAQMENIAFCFWIQRKMCTRSVTSWWCRGCARESCWWRTMRLNQSSRGAAA